MLYNVKRLDDFGRGIIIKDEKICFVKNALPNEQIEIKINTIKKNYCEAEATNIVKQSPYRTTPPCIYYDKCGGCHLEHISFEEENNFKLKKVENILEKFAGITIPVTKITSGKDYFYRNKIVLHVKNQKLGLLEERSHNFIEINECLLVDDEINKTIEKLREIIKDESGIKKIMIRLGNHTNQIMLNITGYIKNFDKFLAICDSLAVNNEKINQQNIVSQILDYKYFVSADSFFQVNREIVEKLYQRIGEIVKASNAINVLDLYCGVGTIGITISKYVTKVVGIEKVPAAITNANQNKELNKIKNIEFILGKVEDIIQKENLEYDTIIVDPPRQGLDKKSINVINNSKAPHIIYVSCDPITLARDLKLLNNYTLKEIELFNMFPRTYHVECLCQLELH